MNTIKFTPKSDMRKETSNVELFSIEEIMISNKNYKYFSDAHISLYITKRCNANCGFCMNKFEDRFVYCKELNDESYYKMLDYYLDFFKDIKPWISITGGEPTDSARLIPVLELIKMKGYQIRTFSTNGSGLLKKHKNKFIIHHLLENNVLNNVSLGRMAVDDELNSKLMGISIDNSNNEMIAKIASFSNVNDIEFRLSCNLLDNGVSNLEDILEYKKYYNSIGVKTVMFRELVATKNNYVSIKNVFQEIREDKNFKLLKKIEGLYYKVYVYSYKDYIVKCYLEKEVVDEEVIREFVIYPDGKLDNGFNNNTLMEVLENE